MIMKKEIKKGKITLEDLDSGISSVDSKFNTLSNRVNSLAVTMNSLIATIESLAISVAKGFESTDKEISEVKENVKATRSDILKSSDRFVSYRVFDELASRVNNLEKKNISKK